MKEIMEAHPDDRLSQEINFLAQQTRNYECFKNIKGRHKKTHKIHWNFCKYMKIMVLKQGQTVFWDGDKGENFYIVLSGSVNVYLQKTVKELETDKEIFRNNIDNLFHEQMIKVFQSKLMANLFLIYCFKDNYLPELSICQFRLRKLLGYVDFDKI